MKRRPAASVDTDDDARSSKKVAVGSSSAKPTRVGVDTATAIAVAEKVLQLHDNGDNWGVLRVLGDAVGPSASTAACRKAFLRISMLIHPDKLQGFREATKAFQALVSAFDQTQAPPPTVDVKRTGQKALDRSNEGCFRTEICCPRCKELWGRPVEGNPKYFYNFMMQGLRSFNCSTCLLEFGCMTAIHKCPWCKGTFDYSPDKFHSKIKCGNPQCGKPFGFITFPASESALRYARETARYEFDRKTREAETKRSRAQRWARRLGGSSEADLAEHVFLEGLADTCPRCGKDLAELGGDGAQMQHLRECTDGAAHKRFQEQKKQQDAASAKAEKKKQEQMNVSANALWDVNGGRIGQLWMLQDMELRKKCKQAGIGDQGDRVALIQRLADHGMKKRGAKPLYGTAEDMPQNLHGLDNKQLAAICACNGVHGVTSREDRLEALLNVVHDGLALTDETPALPARAKALPIKDKRYLKQQGRPILTPSSGNGSASSGRGKAAASAKISVQKRRKVVSD